MGNIFFGGNIFCAGFVCEFLINVSVGMEFSVDYQKGKEKKRKKFSKQTSEQIIYSESVSFPEDKTFNAVIIIMHIYGLF